MRLTWLCPWVVLSLASACADAAPSEGDDSPLGTDLGPSGSTAGQTAGGNLPSGGGDNALGGGTAGSSTGSTGSTGSTSGNLGASGGDGEGQIDPANPPTPAAACGDLQAVNGRIIPNFGSVPNGKMIDFDPIQNGAFKTVKEDKTLKNPDPKRNDYKTTMYVPSMDGSKPASGPFPLIVLLPGFSGNHTVYGHFIDQFVSYGIAVLGVTPANVAFTDAPNNPANIAEVLNALEWGLAESIAKGKIDETKMATAGHSQGGKLAFYTAVEDSRFDLVIGWDPQNGGGAPCFIAGIAGQNCNAWPIAPSCDKDRKFESEGRMNEIRAETLVFAANDGNTTPDKHLWAENFYRGAPSTAHLVLFPKASHGDWAADNLTSQISKRVQIALVLSRFFGMKGAEKYLPGGDYLKGESTVGTATTK